MGVCVAGGGHGPHYALPGREGQKGLAKKQRVFHCSRTGGEIIGTAASVSQHDVEHVLLPSFKLNATSLDCASPASLSPQISRDSEWLA